MKLTFIIPADGKLPEGIRATLQRLIPTFAGKKMTLELREWKEKRSLDQNAYYRGVVLPHVRMVMFESGDANTVEYWHEVLLSSFAPMVDVVNIRGEVTKQPQRTHLMDVQTMAAFITAISAEMASRGWPVPIKEGMYAEGL